MSVLPEEGRQRFRARRIDLSLPVDLAFGRSAGPVEGRSLNMSETGFLVHTGKLQDPGTPVHFDFPGRRANGVGEVVWSRAAEGEKGGAYVGISLKRHARDVLIELMEGSRW
jgi:hypothetical protein